MIAEPSIISGAKTPAEKLAARDEAIAAQQAGKRVARNNRTIAKERSSAPAPNADPLGEYHGDALRERQEELRAWLGVNRRWFGAMPPGEQDALLDVFWRYAKGLTTLRAFRAAADTARIAVEGLPEPADVQRARYHDAVLRQARLSDSPPSRGW